MSAPVLVRVFPSMSTKPADLGPTVILIVDEFSTMTDEDYDAALVAWLTEVDAADAVVVPLWAADTLRGLREHREG